MSILSAALILAILTTFHNFNLSITIYSHNPRVLVIHCFLTYTCRIFLLATSSTILSITYTTAELNYLKFFQIHHKKKNLTGHSGSVRWPHDQQQRSRLCVRGENCPKDVLLVSSDGTGSPRMGRRHIHWRWRVSGVSAKGFDGWQTWKCDIVIRKHRSINKILSCPLSPTHKCISGFYF